MALTRLNYNYEMVFEPKANTKPTVKPKNNKQTTEIFSKGSGYSKRLILKDKG